MTPLDVDAGDGRRERTGVSLVSGSYLSTLGVEAALGRTFTREEDRIPGAHPIAVASFGYWQRHLAGDPSVPGRVVRVSGTPVTIVGVAPAGFFGEEVGMSPDLWMPLTMWGTVVPGRNLLQSAGTGWLRLIGRLPAGAVTSGVHPELTALFRQVLTGIFGPNLSEDARRDIDNATISFQPAARGQSGLRAQFARPLLLLMGAGILVLLIACANIANLLLARSASRRREIDTRLALGMTRARLLRQLFTESLLLAGAGGAMGVAVAWLGREALLRLITADGSRPPVAVEIDGRLLFVVAATSIATAIVFGFAPAWQSMRSSLSGSLGARRDAGGPQRLRAVLIAAQVAVSLVLMMGAGLFLQTLSHLAEVDLGVAPDRLLVLETAPQRTGTVDERALVTTRELQERMRAVPGVSAVAVSQHGVLSGVDNGTNLMRSEGFVAGREGFPRTRWDVVGPGYFGAVGAPLRAGRDFDEHDTAGSAPVVIVNHTMSRLFFGADDAVGRRLTWDGSRFLQIVGVVSDVKQGGPRSAPEPRFYLAYRQLPLIRPAWALGGTRFIVRTERDPAALAPVLRQMVLSSRTAAVGGKRHDWHGARWTHAGRRSHGYLAAGGLWRARAGPGVPGRLRPDCLPRRAAHRRDRASHRARRPTSAGALAAAAPLAVLDRRRHCSRRSAGAGGGAWCGHAGVRCQSDGSSDAARCGACHRGDGNRCGADPVAPGVERGPAGSLARRVTATDGKRRVGHEW